MNRQGYLELYLLLLVPLILLIVFKYIPMVGIVMAFQDYNIFEGIFKSEFIGLEHFRRIFSNPDFYKVLWNTLFINIYKLFFWIPLPVILAILISEIYNVKLKKIVQTAVYLPHFLSWVIVGGIFTSLLAVNGGMVNEIIRRFGGTPIRFMYEKRVFREIIVVSAMWKEVGFGTVVYLGAIAGIDTQMFEAAVIDGASRIKQIWYITIPSIISTVMVILIMSLGSLLSNSFEQIFVMYNPAVYDVADVISTYVYRYGLGQMEYGYSTAVGLFNGVVGFILVLSANTMCKKFFDKTLW
jgi:putative aldouronate transport system permease protein